MQFKDVLGNEDLKSRLVRMVDSGRTGHSLMFVEKDGYGALPLAVALVQYMMCRNRIVGKDSCGVCPSCRKISEMMHPDLHFAFPVNVPVKASSSRRPVSSSFMQDWISLYRSDPYFTEPGLYRRLGIGDKVGVISVAEAREILESLSLKSYEGFSKYMLVWLPERMNTEASNRLLKIVEEPSPDTYFIFITHAPERVLSTVRSRSQTVLVHPVDVDEMASWLSDKAGIPVEQARVFSRISGGSPGLALDMAGEESAASVYLPIVYRMLDNVVNADLPALLEGNDEVLSMGREKQKELCVYAMDFLRKVMMHSMGLASIADVLPCETDAVKRFGSVLPAVFHERAFKAFDGARAEVDANVNAKMVFCNLVNILFGLYNFK